MNQFAVGGIAFVFVFGTALFGMLMRSRLPEHHLSGDSKDAIKLATAIIGTLSALALGLLVASSKRSFDEASAELRSWSAHVVLLDRAMAHYGPQTEAMRATLRTLIEVRLRQVHGEPNAETSIVDAQDIEEIQDGLRALAPQNEAQHWLQTRALQLSAEIAEARWLRSETEIEGFPDLFITVLVLWLSLLFGSFGLLAPTNATVIGTLCISSLAVTGAMVLIIDMDHPYLGLIRISDASLVSALHRAGHPTTPPLAPP